MLCYLYILFYALSGSEPNSERYAKAYSPSVIATAGDRLRERLTTSYRFRPVDYLRWKTRAIGRCSGRTTLTVMVPSGDGVKSHGNRSIISGRHLQDIAIPPSLALQILARMNSGVVLGVCNVFVKEHPEAPSYTKLRETMMMPCRSAIVTVPFNDRLTSRSLGRTRVQVPFRLLWSRARAEMRKEGRQDDPGDLSS